MLPGFISAPVKPAGMFAPLSYYYIVSNRNIGLYILEKGGYRLVFGSQNASDQDIKNIVGSWQRFAKQLFI